jgi:hypothetical protein
MNCSTCKKPIKRYYTYDVLCEDCCKIILKVREIPKYLGKHIQCYKCDTYVYVEHKNAHADCGSHPIEEIDDECGKDYWEELMNWHGGKK